MQRLIYPLLFLILILSACEGGGPATQAVPPSAVESTPPPHDLPVIVTEADTNSPALPIPKFISTVSTPHIDQPPDGMIASETPSPTSEGCAYTWAYKDLPEISAEFQRAVQEIRPEAQANAYAFGEDCVYADGQRTFLAMETDFNVILPVENSNDKESLGDLIASIMKPIVKRFPRGVVPGAQNGFVQFTFTKDQEQQGFRVPIDKYLRLPTGLSGSDLYDALAPSP